MSYFDRDVRYLIEEPWHPKKPVMTRCPNPDHVDAHDSYAVYPNGGYCFGCGFQERAIEIVKRLGGNVADLPLVTEASHQGVARRVKEVHEQDWQAQIRLWHRVLGSYRSDRMSYLTDTRGLSERTLTTFLVGHTGSHFSIPLWDEHGTLAGYKLRYDPAYEDPLARNPAKYVNQSGLSPVIFVPSMHDPLPPEAPGWWIAEGELDTLLLHDRGYRAVTVSHGVQSIERLLPWLIAQQPREVVIALDADPPGKEMAAKLEAALYSRVDQLYRFEPPEEGLDVSDIILLGKDLESYLV